MDNAFVQRLALNIPHLKRLCIPSCHTVDDNGLMHIHRLQQLEELDISGCNKITDEGEKKQGIPFLAAILVLNNLDSTFLSC